MTYFNYLQCLITLYISSEARQHQTAPNIAWIYLSFALLTKRSYKHSVKLSINSTNFWRTLITYSVLLRFTSVQKHANTKQHQTLPNIRTALRFLSTRSNTYSVKLAFITHVSLLNKKNGKIFRGESNQDQQMLSSHEYSKNMINFGSKHLFYHLIVWFLTKLILHPAKMQLNTATVWLEFRQTTLYIHNQFARAAFRKILRINDSG